jgi:hypothetical protein
LQSEVLHKIRTEAKVIVMVGAFLLIGLKIVLFSEAFLSLVRITAALMWMYVIPGYVLLFSAKDMPLPARMGIGTCAAIALYGIMSYYLGIVGAHVRFHWTILPFLMIGFGYLLFAAKKENIT